MATIGASAAPVVRATPVMPAAAVRSIGSTAAMTNAWRVGTSICEMEKRSSRTPIASGSVGISGTRMSRIVRREVREDHRVQKADAPRDARAAER
jgi:hypothetical protein